MRTYVPQLQRVNLSALLRLYWGLLKGQGRSQIPNRCPVLNKYRKNPLTHFCRPNKLAQGMFTQLLHRSNPHLFLHKNFCTIVQHDIPRSTLAAGILCDKLLYQDAKMSSGYL